MLGILPVEMVLVIGDFLSSRTLRSMTQVSQRLRSIFIPLLYDTVEFRAASEWALNIMDIDSFFQTHSTSRDKCYLQYTRNLRITAPIVIARFNRCAYFNVFRNSTTGGSSSSLGTSNEAKAHAQFLDDISRQLQMLQLHLEPDKLHSLRWHLGTCIPPGFLNSGGYVSRYQTRLRRISLITDGSCPHAGQCLGGLRDLPSLSSLEWEGIRQGDELEVLRACIIRNRAHLITLSIGFLAPMAATNFYTEVLGLRQDSTQTGCSARPAEIQHPSMLNLALSKVYLPRRSCLSSIPKFNGLKSLTLRDCPNSLEFLSSFTESQGPPHLLLHFEFCYESFDADENDHDARPLATFLLLIDGLKHLHLKLSNFPNSYHVSRAISKHQPTLETLVYHERSLRAIGNDGLFEDVRDQTPAWLYRLPGAWLYKLPGIDKGGLTTALALCMEPHILQSFLERNSRISRLQVLHLRFTGSEKAHQNVREEILDQLCSVQSDKPNGDIVFQSAFCYKHPNEINSFQERPGFHSLVDKQVRISPYHQHGSAMSEATRYSQFINWAFGPHGLPRLQVLAIGDFSLGDRYHNQQLLLYRDMERIRRIRDVCADGSRDLSNDHQFCVADVNDESVWNATSVNDSSFLSVCPEHGLMDSPYE